MTATSAVASSTPAGAAPAVAAGWTMVACPLCGAKEQEVVFEAVGAYFGTQASACLRRCACGLLLTNPQPRGEALAAYYASEQYYTHAAAGGLTGRLRACWQRLQLRGPLAALRLAVERRSNLRRWTMRFAPEHFPLRRGQSLLDYGCGNGGILRLARDLGLRVVGVEPDPTARARAQGDASASEVLPVARTLEEADALAHQVLAGQAAAGPAGPARYDRIVLRHVLEHLPDPLGTLCELKDRLTPAGRLLVAVPNAASAQAEAFGRFWLGYDLPRHLWHFAPETLRRLAERAGLCCAHLETVELRSFADVSRAAAVGAGAAAPRYDPGRARDLEASGRGAEVVMVAGRS